MISVHTPDGDKVIAAVSVRTPSGNVTIAAASVLTPTGSVSLWSGGSPGGGGGGGTLTVSLDPVPVTGATAKAGTGSVTTQECVATPTGGVGTYSYAWTKTAGGSEWSVISPTAANTRFRCSAVDEGSSSEATFQVTVSDARGNSATASVTATVQNYGSLSDVFI